MPVHPITRSPDHSPDEWIFKKEEQGVKVWYQKNGAGDSHTFKSESYLDCPLSGIVKLFLDTEHYPRWGYRMEGTYTFRKVSPLEFFYYSRYDFPWPMSDRDVVMHSVFVQDKTTRQVVLNTRATPDEYPLQKNLVRLREASAFWTFTPTNRGHTHCMQILQTDGGGQAPAWAVNLGADEGMIRTIVGIRKQLRDGGYRKVKLEFIKD
jgi:hypothetical protein